MSMCIVLVSKIMKSFKKPRYNHFGTSLTVEPRAENRLKVSLETVDMDKSRKCSAMMSSTIRRVRYTISIR